MVHKEIIIKNVVTGEEKKFIGVEAAANYLGISRSAIYSRFKSNKIVNDEKVIIPGLHYYKKKKLNGKHIKGDNYTLDVLNTRTAVFTSSRVMVDGDTEDSLKGEISAYVKGKIKEIDTIADRFILTASTYNDKCFYELTFLFNEEMGIKDKDKIIRQFLPY